MGFKPTQSVLVGQLCYLGGIFRGQGTTWYLLEELDRIVYTRQAQHGLHAKEAIYIYSTIL